MRVELRLLAMAAGAIGPALLISMPAGAADETLAASWATQTIYLAILVAAVARVCAVLNPTHDFVLLHIAACAWVLAFFGYAIAFGPLLLGSKRRAFAVR